MARRGMRFGSDIERTGEGVSSDISGKARGPVHSSDGVFTYVVSGSVQESIPTDRDRKLKLRDPRAMTSGSVYVTASLDTEGNLNFRNLKMRNRYDRWLVGSASMNELGVEVTSSTRAALPPSWVQSHAGINHAHVIVSHSSSDYETHVLNAYFSGNAALEATAVPASGAVHYVKSRMVTKIYAVTASVLLATGSGASGTFVAGSGTRWPFASNTPFVVPVDVSDRGKIKNIRVWIEFINGSGGTPNSGSSLRGTIVALRAPNRKFEFGLPYLNDPKVKPLVQGANTSYVLGTYILYMRENIPATTHGWAEDRSMRTIFDDAAKTRNPWHIDQLYASGSKVTTHMHELGFDSPSHAFRGVPYATGSQVQWTSDVTITPDSGEGAAGSPPSGWLTAPGGVAAENEWPTTGSNYGPATIRPQYSLLDDVVVRRNMVVGGGLLQKDYIEGTRPGLRGAEMHGQWDLIFDSNYVGTNAVIGHFRQVRLEITFEASGSIGGDYARRNSQRFRKRHIVNGSPGTSSRWAILSSSVVTAQDGAVLNAKLDDWFEMFVQSPDDHGRTVGITDATGSSDFAVFTRITGSLLEDQLLDANTWWFLDNEFGTPSIPISSASTVDNTSIVADTGSAATFVADVFSQKVSISPFKTAHELASVRGANKTLRQIAAEKSSGSA